MCSRFFGTIQSTRSIQRNPIDRLHLLVPGITIIARKRQREPCSGITLPRIADVIRPDSKPIRTRCAAKFALCAWRNPYSGGAASPSACRASAPRPGLASGRPASSKLKRPLSKAASERAESSRPLLTSRRPQRGCQPIPRCACDDHSSAEPVNTVASTHSGAKVPGAAAIMLAQAKRRHQHYEPGATAGAGSGASGGTGRVGLTGGRPTVQRPVPEGDGRALALV
jgi:hypothetical protein